MGLGLWDCMVSYCGRLSGKAEVRGQGRQTGLPEIVLREPAVARARNGRQMDLRAERRGDTAPGGSASWRSSGGTGGPLCGMLQRLENQAPKDPLDGTRLLVVSVCEAAGLGC